MRERLQNSTARAGDWTYYEGYRLKIGNVDICAYSVTSEQYVAADPVTQACDAPCVRPLLCAGIRKMIKSAYRVMLKNHNWEKIVLLFG